MRQVLKSLATGIFAGVISYQVTIYTLGVTFAFARPVDLPSGIWQVVIFGLGVTLVAGVIHLTALATTKTGGLVPFVGFCAAFIACLALAGLPATGFQAVTAAAIGALLATLAARLRSNNSFKPNLLRKSA